MPEMMGVKLDFMTCRADEARPSRKACLPKKECLAAPASCIKMNSQGFLSGIGGFARFNAEVAAGMESAVEPAAPAAGPASPAPAAAPAPQPAKQPMSSSRFARLMEQVEDASFQSERNEVLRVAAERNYFRCKQAGQVLSTISFADEKLSALRILAPRLVDPENHHILLDHFTFDDEKVAARRILEP
jgi:hypothetical protein